MGEVLRESVPRRPLCAWRADVLQAAARGRVAPRVQIAGPQLQRFPRESERARGDNPSFGGLRQRVTDR
jgi:hypothetical protein